MPLPHYFRPPKHCFKGGRVPVSLLSFYDDDNDAIPDSWDDEDAFLRGAQAEIERYGSFSLCSAPSLCENPVAIEAKRHSKEEHERKSAERRLSRERNLQAARDRRSLARKEERAAAEKRYWGKRAEEEAAREHDRKLLAALGADTEKFLDRGAKHQIDGAVWRVEKTFMMGNLLVSQVEKYEGEALTFVTTVHSARLVIAAQRGTW